MAITGTAVTTQTPIDYGDLLTWTRRRYGDTRTDRDEQLIKECCNQALRQVAVAADWPGYQTLGRVLTKASLKDGTVTVTKDSTAVSFSETWADGEPEGGWLRVGSDQYDIRIETMTGVMTGTLAEAYPGATQTDVSYEVHWDRYDLSELTHRVRAVRGILHDRYWHPLAVSVQEWLEAKWYGSGVTGTRWAFDGQWLYVYPAPSSAGELAFVYQRWPAALVNETDGIDMQTGLEDLLKARVLVELADVRDEQATLGQRMTRYQAELQQCKRALLQPQLVGQQRESIGMGNHTAITHWHSPVNSVVRIAE